ncbi:hypothetical protein TcBrA4_0113010 [Trypanosoma cruzi]|nr:hypothetical protein TcBrA4_0113010 [Trypanosoma cruzi]
MHKIKGAVNTQADENHKAQISNQKIKMPNKTNTTTTSAPETPTTTTEAPTTTSSRAPLRLREVDVSLSGSAWMCAPLLLAVSALTYATVG